MKIVDKTKPKVKMLESLKPGTVFKLTEKHYENVYYIKVDSSDNPFKCDCVNLMSGEFYSLDSNRDVLEANVAELTLEF